jgi:hypothetical protein
LVKPWSNPQALVLRNRTLLWTASIGFELLEFSFRVGPSGLPALTGRL